MIAATVSANVLGNMVAAPLLPNGRNTQLSTPVAGVTAGDYTAWQDYGWQSSEVPGAQVTLQGQTVLDTQRKVQASRFERVPVEGRPKVYSQTVDLEPQSPILPTEPEQSAAEKLPPPAQEETPAAEDKSHMNTSMLVGAVAGAIVAQSTGYHLVLGAAAGALVGHFYAAGTYK